MKAFLTPTLADETGAWDDIVQKKVRVRNAKSAIGIVGLMRTPKDLSVEFKLLMISSFLNVCLLEERGSEESKVLGKLFRSPVSGDTIGIKIFDRWKQEALETLNQLGSANHKNELWYQETAAFLLLRQFLIFVQKCFVIKSAAHLNTLKEKHEMDWNQPSFLNDVSACDYV